MKAFAERFGAWLLARLEEKSTYTGLTILFAIWGRHIPQPVMDAIQWFGPFLATGLMVASTKG